MAIISELYGSGTVPKIGDTIRMLLVKEVQSTNAGGGGGGGGGSGSVLSGAGLPTAVYPAGPGAGILNAIYTDQNTGNEYSWYLGAWHG